MYQNIMRNKGFRGGELFEIVTRLAWFQTSRSGHAKWRYAAVTIWLTGSTSYTFKLSMAFLVPPTGVWESLTSFRCVNSSLFSEDVNRKWGMQCYQDAYAIFLLDDYAPFI